MSDYADCFTALIDANVLACAMRRNIILSLAEAGFFRPRWSDRIMDETAVAIAKITMGGADTNKQRSAMERAFLKACVTGYAGLEAGLGLPDPDDRHVLAAAVTTSAQVIVTENLKDFPSKAFVPFDIDAILADEFISDAIKLDPLAAVVALRKMRERFKNPDMDAQHYCSGSRLEKALSGCRYGL
jgi:predicted nucleic acid-binding protein